MSLDTWVAWRIREEFGARIPSVSTGPWQDPRPRAERIGGAPVHESQMPVYKQRHYEEWKRQARMVVACAERPGEGGWRALCDLMGIAPEAIGADSILGFNLEVHVLAPPGLGPDGLVKRLLVACAMSPAIAVEVPRSAQGEAAPDILVRPSGGAAPGSRMEISVIGRGGVDQRAEPQPRPQGGGLLGALVSLVEGRGQGSQAVSRKEAGAAAPAAKRRRGTAKG